MLSLTRFSANQVPMAPSTAFLFILAGAGLLFNVRAQKSGIAPYLLSASGIVIVCLSGLFLYFRFSGIYTEWEYFFISFQESSTSFKIGYMSPVTAILFIITGFSVLFICSRQKTVRVLGLILILGLFLANFLFLIGYLFEVPFFYTENFIPPAALTVISFIVSALAVLSASDKKIILIRQLLGKSISAKIFRRFLPLIVALTILYDIFTIRVLPLLNINAASGIFISELIFIVAVGFIFAMLSQNLGKSLDSSIIQLQTSEQKFRSLFENSSVGISLTGINGSLNVNRSFCNILGYSQDELKKKNWKEITHPDDIDKTDKFVQSARDGQLDQMQFEKRYIHKTGEVIWTDVTSFLHRNDQGQPEYFITSIFNITDRKKSEIENKQFLTELEQNKKILLSILSDQKEVEESLGKSKSLLNRTQQLTKVGGWEYDVHQNKYTYTDEIFNIYGTELHTPGQGMTFYHPDDISVASKAFSKAIDENKAYDIELRFINAQGKKMWVRTMGNPVAEEDGKVVRVVGTLMDITQKKQAERENKMLQNQLMQVQKIESIGTLAGGVAHEINNPINGIMNYAQLILDKTDKKSQKAEYASEIIHETKRVATIVRNLLTFARQEKETHSPAQLKAIIDDTLSLIQTVLKKDQISLEIDVPDELPKINCHSQQIQQVIMNLITNARDALNEKYPEYDENKKIMISSAVFEKNGTNWIRLVVEDHGTGIDSDIQDKIFDPFFTTKNRASGTGFGLSISYGIMKDHQGELSVESEPGEYTRFHMDFFKEVINYDSGYKNIKFY